MFSSGEVVFVESDQAAGYRRRNKYHTCICGARGIYFFINSRNWEGSFELLHDEFPALPNAQSYIACNTVLAVSDQYMKQNNARSEGMLPRLVIEKLIDHVENCDVLSDDEKEIVIDGLTTAL